MKSLLHEKAAEYNIPLLFIFSHYRIVLAKSPKIKCIDANSIYEVFHMHVKTAARALLRMGKELDKNRDYRNADFVTRMAAALLEERNETIPERDFDRMYAAQRRIEENGGMSSYERAPDAAADELYPGVPADSKLLKDRALSDPRIPTDEFGTPRQGLKQPGWEAYDKKLPSSMFLSLDQMKRQIAEMSPEEKRALLLSK